MGKEKLYDDLSKIYKWCNKQSIKIVMAIVFMWFVAIIWDVYPRVCGATDCFFSYNIGDIIAISVVVWTFMMTLFMYYFGRIDEICYGIRRYESFLNDFQNDFQFYCIFFIAFGELLMMIIVAVWKLKATLVLNAMILLATMLYVLIVICIKTSRSNIVEQIRNRISKGNYDLLCKMARNMSLEDNEEKDKIIEILSSDLFDMLYQKVKDKNCDKKMLENDIYNVAKCLLDREKSSPEEIWEILMNWINEIERIGNIKKLGNKGEDEKKLLNQTILVIQKGIIKAVFEDLTNKRYMKFLELLNLVSEDRYRQLMIWTRAYNIYLQGKAGLQWRESVTKDLKTYIKESKYNQNELLMCVKEFYGEERDKKIRKGEQCEFGNFYKAFPYIFGTR